LDKTTNETVAIKVIDLDDAVDDLEDIQQGSSTTVTYTRS